LSDRDKNKNKGKVQMKYSQLLSDLERYVSGDRSFEAHYLVLLNGLLQLRFSVEERFHDRLAYLTFNPAEVLEGIKYDIETINENGSIGNSYYAFYLEVLEFVNDYCLKRIDTVGISYRNGPARTKNLW
jgi:hypothetical protein